MSISLGLSLYKLQLASLVDVFENVWQVDVGMNTSFYTSPFAHGIVLEQPKGRYSQGSMFLPVHLRKVNCETLSC